VTIKKSNLFYETFLFFQQQVKKHNSQFLL